MQGFNVWKPIAPNGYVALGLVIDIRPLNGCSIEENNKYQPSAELIACVPEDSIKTSDITENTSWNNINEDEIIDFNSDKTDKLNLITNNLHLIYSKTDEDLEKKGFENKKNIEFIKDEKTYICEPPAPSEVSESIPPKDLKTSEILDKKYSILKIYE